MCMHVTVDADVPGSLSAKQRIVMHGLNFPSKPFEGQ